MICLNINIAVMLPISTQRDLNICSDATLAKLKKCLERRMKLKLAHVRRTEICQRPRSRDYEHAQCPAQFFPAPGSVSNRNLSPHFSICFELHHIARSPYSFRGVVA